MHKRHFLYENHWSIIICYIFSKNLYNFFHSAIFFTVRIKEPNVIKLTIGATSILASSKCHDNKSDASQRRLFRSTKENCLMYMEGKHVFNPIDQNIFIGLLSYADKVGSETKETKLNSQNNEIQRNRRTKNCRQRVESSYFSGPIQDFSLLTIQKRKFVNRLFWIGKVGEIHLREKEKLRNSPFLLNLSLINWLC